MPIHIFKCQADTARVLLRRCKIRLLAAELCSLGGASVYLHPMAVFLGSQRDFDLSEMAI